LTKKLEDEGLKILTARDGMEGLKVALDEHPDLILLDVVLPVMDGVTFLEKLRQDSWGKRASVIVLSNLSKVATFREGEEMGVRDYLVKTDWKLKDVIEKVEKELENEK
jgi:DNA-binding response OmpR family regulator